MATTPTVETEGREAAHLERGLGALDAATIVVGSMIGSGIFITSAESSRLVGAPGWLLYIIPADLVFYVLMVGAVFVLRRKAPDAARPYRTPGYPLVPLVYVLLATLLTLDLVYLAPKTSGLGFLLVLTGLPVYFAWRRGSRQ